jgi:hypothetical protein
MGAGQDHSGLNPEYGSADYAKRYCRVVLYEELAFFQTCGGVCRRGFADGGGRAGACRKARRAGDRQQ